MADTRKRSVGLLWVFLFEEGLEDLGGGDGIKTLFLLASGKIGGIEQISEDVSRLWYCDYLLGEIDHRKWQIAPAKSRPLICAYAQISGYKPE